jgi:hypothetical protein
MTSDYRNQYLKEIQLKKHTYKYGRCVNVSTGLILGLLIDKILFVLTKGISVVIPPFAAMLMCKGKLLFRIRFDKKFGKIGEIIISHFVS